MSDSGTENLKGFEERIRRIEGAKRPGARVSYKRSGEYFRKDEERRRQNKKGRKANWTLRTLLVLVCVLGVKTYIMAHMGTEAYDARMAELQAGDNYEKAAFFVMQRDPLTGKLQEILVNRGFVTPAPTLREQFENMIPEAEVPAVTEEADPTVVEPASGSSVVEGTAN